MKAKTPIEFIKKYNVHFYKNDEQDIVDAMHEFAKQEAIEFHLEYQTGKFEQLTMDEAWDKFRKERDK